MRGRKVKEFDLSQAIVMRSRTPRPGWRSIAKELALGVSYQTIRRRIIDYELKTKE